MNDIIETNNLFDCKTEYLKDLFASCVYPWEILPKIKEYIKTLISSRIEDFTQYADGVLIGKNVKIYPSVVIEAPAIIGHNTEIRPGAFIRGNVITGSNCVIGNSTELKNSVLLNNVQIPHYNYVGDSILGNFSHMGAGAICSNLKADGKNVVIHGNMQHTTNLRKIGGILGDGANVGCGCVLNPGTVLGKNTTVYPLTCLRGVFKENCIVKAQNNVVAKKF